MEVFSNGTSIQEFFYTKYYNRTNFHRHRHPLQPAILISTLSKTHFLLNIFILHARLCLKYYRVCLAHRGSMYFKSTYSNFPSPVRWTELRCANPPGRGAHRWLRIAVRCHSLYPLGLQKLKLFPIRTEQGRATRYLLSFHFWSSFSMLLLSFNNICHF